MATVNEAGRERRVFVGDMSVFKALEGGGMSQIDEIRAEARMGNVNVLYDDEDISKARVKMSSGFFGRRG